MSTMDPVTLATVTAAVTVLANEAGKVAAGEAGKSVWKKVQGLLGWSAEPPSEDVAKRVAETLHTRPELAGPILETLKQGPNAATAIVGSITAEKVAVIGGDVHGNVTF